jgi:metal-dependent amidase/aminoacylase/carboxypeptidase family protein
VDPILVAAHTLVRIHTLVIELKEMMSLTCRQFHSGWPGADYRSYVDMNIDIKAYNPGVRAKALSAITTMVEAECTASGFSDKPVIKHTVRAPLTISTPELVHKICSTFEMHLKTELVEQKPNPSCEDFSILATSRGLPYVYWTLGGTDPEVWKKAEESDNPGAILPNNHSPYYVPVIQPTMRIGTDAMALAVLTFLGSST